MLPSYVIIGEQKTGTGWLLDRLREHPEVFCYPKEVNYFNRERNYARGPAWYASRFAGGAGCIAVGEKSPDYFWLRRPDSGYCENPLERIAHDLPEARIVLSLRDPVDRAASAFNHHLQHRGRRIHPALTRKFGLDVLMLEDRFGIAQRLGLIERGFYAERLSLAQDLFGERLLTLIFEQDIVADPAGGLRKVCEHLGVDFDPTHFRLKHNRKAAKPSYAELLGGHYVPVLRPVLRRLPLGKPYQVRLSPTERKQLGAIYSTDRAATLELLGLPEDQWGIWRSVGMNGSDAATGGQACPTGTGAP